MRLACTIVILLLTGCAGADYNAFPTHSEADSLANVTPMTDGFTRANGARFSPDQQWLFFQAIPPNESAFAVYAGHVRRTGDHILGMETPIRVTPAGSRGVCPAVSSDGVTLLLASTAGKPSNDDQPLPVTMELFRTDNWEGAVAVADPVAGIDLTRRSITENNAYDAEPSVSPDGRSIVFTSKRDGPRALYVMRLDGSGAKRLTTAPGEQSSPSFSIDGKYIVFRQDARDTHRGQIATAVVMHDVSGDVSGLSMIKTLTDPKELCLDPACSPDGEHIVYVRQVNSTFQLYLMRHDGSSKTRLTFGAKLNVSPAFSPDGTRLVWTSLRDDARTPQLFIADFHMPTGAD